MCSTVEADAFQSPVPKESIGWINKEGFLVFRFICNFVRCLYMPVEKISVSGGHVSKFIQKR